MIRLLLVFLFSFALSTSSYGQDCETVPQIIDSADFVLKNVVLTLLKNQLVVSEGRKLNHRRWCNIKLSDIR